MRDDLLLYYERELTFLRQMGVEFAGKYPKIASRLVLEPDKCEDPHVERLIEAFAFLAARVHLKIDDEFPEITEALLSIVYPHYIRPIPSMSVVQFQVDTQPGGLTAPQPIKSGSILNSRPVGGVPCQFRTTYPTTVYPIVVTEADWRTPDRLNPPIKSYESAGCFRIQLRCPPEVTFEKLGVDTLRFFIDGESSLTHIIYELLHCNCFQIVIRDTKPNTKIAPVTLPPDSLRAVGFAEDEAMLPYPMRSFAGYRLLQEYFTFPEKFLFFDIVGMQEVWGKGINSTAEIVFLISPFELPDRRQFLELSVSARTFRLNCSPIVNLFPQTAEPILVDQRNYEYSVIPDVRRVNALEIFSVDEVVTITPTTNELIKYEPFYSYRHSTVRERKQTFWMANRRQSGRRDDDGTEIYLSMVDLSTRPVLPDADTITVRTTCTNRDLPSRLPFGNENGDFELEGGAAIKKIIALKKPTPTVRPPIGKSALWRLISHLSLNYLSLVDEGKESLQEILKLYSFTGSSFSEKHIEGIMSVESRRHFARVFSENGIAFVRGTQVEINFDEEQFVGSGVFLFASVLEAFLGLYVSLNSFSQLIARTRQRKEILKQWPPKAGQRILL
jgi:type VI secretion system protein ImpG